MPDFLTAALYKFVTLPDFAALQAPLQAFCETQDVRGTLLLAEEGINGTIAGPEQGVRAVLAHLRGDPRLADLAHKESWAQKLPFYRMKVRLKREIVTLGVPGINPNQMAGRYVKPQDWNALIAEPGVVVVDTRNAYEVGIGTFEGAVDPHTKSFSELPAWVAAQSAPGGLLAEKDGKKPKVAMFCTGGIRCEKSTAFMRTQGFDEVYHLEGGILKYLETVPETGSLWQGECFVFDERVSVVHGLATGHYGLCRACRDPISEADKTSPLYVPGVSCPNCHDKKTEEQKRGFIERQRQVDFANRRRQPHIGAKLPLSGGSSDGDTPA
ncbi:MAG: rhodanese-related sulfurtransferase [Polaromonas sp.]|nr:rhodanese-related sulfurtransferase [Polaromonas sp.]